MTRQSPSTGHGDNLPDSSAYLRAMALELQMRDLKNSLKEKHKRARATIEGAGIVLEDLDTMVKMKDKSAAEVEQWIRRKFASLSSYFSDLKNLELFTPKNPAAKREVYRHKGRMAGVEGKDASPPKGITSDEVNEWMTGWHEGNEARTAAQPVLADILADALEVVEGGDVVDGTRTSTVGRRTGSKRAQTKEKVGMTREEPEGGAGGPSDAERGAGG